MIDHLGLGRLAVLLVLGLVVFGPERLPEIAAQAGRALRHVRQALTGMTAEIKDSLGPEVGDLNLASLHPRTVLAGLMADDVPVASTTATAAPDPFAHLALHEHLPDGEVLVAAGLPDWISETT